MNWLRSGLIGAWVLLSFSAHAAGLAPWQFGMTKEQVASFKEFGPYKTFSNGDLETYNGEFDHEKRNVQFFFNVSGLNRIEINMYEGQASAEAGRAIERVAEYYRRACGEIKASGFDLPAGEDAHKIAESAIAALDTKAKVQVIPVNQPADLRTFSSFRRNEILGRVYYSVVLYLDPPNRKDMPMVPDLLARPPKQ